MPRFCPRALAKKLLARRRSLRKNSNRLPCSALVAGLGDHVDHAAAATSELGAVAVGLHLEFLRAVGRGREHVVVVLRHHHGDAVKCEVIAAVPAAIDRDIGEHEQRRRVIAGGRHRAHRARIHLDAGREPDQIEYVAAADRQLLNGARHHHLAEGCAARFDQRRFGGNCHRGSDVAKLHAEVKTEPAFHLQFDVVSNRGLEAGTANLYLVLARPEIRCFVISELIGHHSDGLIRTCVDNEDFGIGDNGAGSVRHGAEDGAGDVLGQRGRGAQGKC